ncbi:MAG: four helix bundle protein [Bacteroidales bacterium]|nr:four helix bundle protein [Bacteroidales bacterium]
MACDLKLELSENFALDIIQLYKYLRTTPKEYVISNQILRSGTSIGAQLAESVYAESDSDFVHKLSLSLKEASETCYWLRLLHKSQYIPQYSFAYLYERCELIIKVVTAAKVSVLKRIQK